MSLAHDPEILDTYPGVTEEYVPRTYPGRVTVFWPEGDPEPPDEAARWW